MTGVQTCSSDHIGVFFTADENGMILKDIYGIKGNNIYSCLIGTDTSKFYFDDIQRKSLREQYNIKNTDIAIIYTGKHNVIKQPHLVLKAVKNLERKNTIKLFLFFIGSKDEKYFKKHFGERSNYKFEFIYIPEIENDELYKYYSMADIAIFPKENTLSTLDVQACKLPVILEDNQTNRDRIRNSGLLYKKNNLSDLSDKINELITNNELRKKLGENGLVLIEEVYDYKKIISDMENILTKNEP